jgi:serine/threonine protein kinase
MLIRTEDLVGRTIAGYRLLEVLGRGGMSVVFLAQPLDKPQDRVAMKILVSRELSTPEELVSFQARFLREAQAAYQMHQEHILPVLAYGAADDIFYMVMPVITGGTLAERLASEHGHMPLEEIAGYLNQVASAIDYAHQHGVIHRDIKPSNVLIDEKGNAYLVDFGIVHLFDSGSFAIDEAPTRLTTTGRMYGTPAYMAPERFKGEQAEPATDVYALGVMLYFLVTGQLPFKASSPLLIGMKHLNEIPPDPRSLRPDLPEPAEAAILKALAKEPADRFSSASALAAAFGAGIKGQWAQELFPLAPVVPPNPVDPHAAEPTLASIVPIPEGPAQSNPLVLGAAPAIGAAPLADLPTRANPAPAPMVYPQTRSRKMLPWLLLAALALIVVSLVLLLPDLHALFAGSSTPTPTPSAIPTSTHGVPTNPAITPTVTTGTTPSPSPAATSSSAPTPKTTPTTAPATTPTSSSAPGKTPTAASSPTSSPTPATTPSPGTSPTPSQTP